MFNAIVILAIVTASATLGILTSWIANYPVRTAIVGISCSLKRILDTLQPKLIDFKVVKKIFEKQNKLSGQTKDILSDLRYLKYGHGELVHQQQQILDKLESVDAIRSSVEDKGKQQGFFDSNPDLANFICRNGECFQAAFEKSTTPGTWLKAHKARIIESLTASENPHEFLEYWRVIVKKTLRDHGTVEEFEYVLLLNCMIFMEADYKYRTRDSSTE